LKEDSPLEREVRKEEKGGEIRGRKDMATPTQKAKRAHAWGK